MAISGSIARVLSAELPKILVKIIIHTYHE
jgi:hypothetical protein